MDFSAFFTQYRNRYSLKSVAFSGDIILITTTGNYLIPDFYIMFLCIPFFIAVLFIPKTCHNEIFLRKEK
ncbi:hypothetical protein CDV26_00015 [Francisella halioticida]|uniref:Uncharacterized protein n=1 Tax=Francisella halioticida TaxID=549298 RepID=A0ABN5B0C2_9GAMM|nr:hypothetical protein CDV26_00015 [Francisella halioticida]